MNTGSGTSVPVMDFRRRSMALLWYTQSGTWLACDIAPALVHGVAFIRASQPNICLFGQAGRLILQIGTDQYPLSEDAPRLSCARGMASFGFRRRFTVESKSGGILFRHSYWTDRGEDFCRWLSKKASDPQWRLATRLQWSTGVAAAEIRAHWRGSNPSISDSVR